MASRKGALPVPYIVALILAIIVVALLGYWFYTVYIRGESEQSEGICRAKELAFCTQWSAAGYDTGQKPSGGFITNSEGDTPFAPECNIYSWASDVETDSDRCRELLRQEEAGEEP